MSGATPRPWLTTAAQLPFEPYCTCCERKLAGRAIRMLELDQRSDTYHDFGNVPADKSQGWFPFGLTCAKRKLKEASTTTEAGNAG